MRHVIVHELEAMRCLGAGWGEINHVERRTDGFHRAEYVCEGGTATEHEALPSDTTRRPSDEPASSLARRPSTRTIEVAFKYEREQSVVT